MSLIVSNNSSSPLSVSQNIQASQIRYFKLAVDTLFLRMENNLADAEGTHFFNNEDHIIEKADQITEMYENLTLSDEKKYDLRQYILKEADVFDSKFSATYDEISIDNYLEFITISDFDDFRAEKTKAEDQYKVKKCKVVYESDSESESDDESTYYKGDWDICSDCDEIMPNNCTCSDKESESDEEVSMFSETQSEADSDESDHDSSDSESESDDEYEPWVVHEKIKEVEQLKKDNERADENIRIYRRTLAEREAEIRCLTEMNEEMKDFGSKIAILTRENEVKDLNIKRLEALREQDNSIINQYIQNSDKSSKRINELEDKIWTQKNKIDELKNDTCDYDYILKENNKLKNDYQLREDDKKIIKKLKNELTDAREKALSLFEICIEKDDQIKNLKAVIDDLRTQKDENIEQIRQQKEDEDKVRIIRNDQALKLHKIIEEKNKEIFYYESKVREMNEHTKLNNN